MTLNYKEVIPWGRNLDEYRRMFGLTENDLQLSILGCGDGPASFNAEWNEKGGNATSIDPIYQFSADEIQQRINESYQEVIHQVKDNMDKFIWNQIPSIEALGDIRMEAMQRFLETYEVEKAKGNYIEGSLPELPFEDDQFDLCLSSHFLFLYSDHLDTDFHLASVSEMLRVAKEVRIFPILELNGNLSPHLAKVLEALSNSKSEIRTVDYEFQKGANQALFLSRT